MRAGPWKVRFAAGSWAAFWTTIALSVSACTAPKFDPATLQGKAALMDLVNKALTDLDCSSALATIEPLYGSIFSDNKVRFLRASSHGCNSGLTYYGFISFLLNNGAALAGPAFWAKVTELFYHATSSTRVSRVQSGWYGTDALLASLNPGRVVFDNYRITFDDYNPGSVLMEDRDRNANALMLMTAISSIGTLQSHYGAPNTATWARGQKLGATAADPNGWETVTNLDSSTDPTGCSYASAIVNMVDALYLAKTELAGRPVGSILATVYDQFAPLIQETCDVACQGGAQTVAGFPLNFPACNFTDCGGTVAQPCPLTLRNRFSCTGAVTDRNSCAAAGLAIFINQHPGGWN